jgi:ATP-binding cassette subfamily B (MDR/TAP) protein 1
MLQVLAEPEDEDVREGTNQYSLYFVIAGVSVGLATFVQVSQQQVIIVKSI